jgi:Bifunctional DNA primase/polymerase, N-terminal
VSRRGEMLRAGLGYIDRGWPAFILSSSKVPVANCGPCTAEHITPEQMEACDCLCCHGFYAGTLDSGRITEMIRLHPQGLLAIRTGAPSGTAVADVDRAGIPQMREMIADGILPRTVTAASGGDGYHLVYAPGSGGKVMSGAGKIAPGIDSKADGAYIVVAPSVHPRTRKPYRWLSPFTDELTPMPQALVDRLREPERPSSAHRSVQVPGRPGSRYAEAALRGELERLLAVPEGVRNDTLAKECAFSLGQLVAAGALDRERVEALLTQAAEHIGLQAGETRRAIASGLRAGALRPRGGAA